MITVTINKFALLQDTNDNWTIEYRGIVNFVDHAIPKQVVQFETEDEMLQYIEDHDLAVEAT